MILKFVLIGLIVLQTAFSADLGSWTTYTTNSVAYETSGHTTSLIGSDLYVFGGFSPASDTFMSLNGDVFKIVLDDGVPSATFSQVVPDTVSGRYLDSYSAIWQLTYDSTGPSCQIYPEADSSDVTDCSISGSTITWEKLTGDETGEIASDNRSIEWASISIGTFTRIEPESRYGHSAVVRDDKLVIMFGYSGVNYMNDMWRLEDTIWVPLTVNSAPIIRYAQRTAYLGDKLYMFGGFDEDGNALDDMYSLNWDTMTWSQISKSGDWPSARGWHSLTNVEYQTFNSGVATTHECLVLIGGEDASTTKNDEIWKYCTSDHSWTQITTTGETMPILSGHSAALISGGRLLLIGGYTGEYPNDFLQQVLELDMVINVWRDPSDSLTGTFPSDRQRHTMTTVGDSLVIFGGKDRFSDLEDILELDYAPVLCAAGTFSLDGGEPCSDCPAGSYSVDPGSYGCISCPAGTYQNLDGQTECIKCSAGSYNELIGSTDVIECLLCAAGSFNPDEGSTEASACGTCVGGTFSTEGSSGCTDCDPGSYASANSGSCTECEAGSFSLVRASTCTPCPAGEYNLLEGLSACEICPAGFYSTEGSTKCVACAAGTSNPSPGGALADCVSCAEGYYSTTPGSQYCTPCELGEYHAQTGETSDALCTPCTAGEFQSSVGQACESCPKGSYSDSTGATSCDLCGIGTYNPNSGATDPTACVKCPDGQITSSEGAIASTECMSCSKGYYQPSGSYSCLKCPTGTYSTVEGATSVTACVDCPAMTYGPDAGSDSCSTVPQCSFSQVGWTDIIPCDGGCERGPNGNICSNNGSCEGGVCDCDNNWEGTDCGTYTGGSNIPVGVAEFGSPVFLATEGDASTYKVVVRRRSGHYLTAYVEIILDSGATADPSFPDATSGSDYTDSFPLAVNFANGEIAQEITIPILSDAVSDEGCERIPLKLANAAGDFTIGDLSSAVLIISDPSFSSSVSEQDTASGSNISPSSITAAVGSTTLDLSISVTRPLAEDNLELMLVQDVSSTMTDDLVNFKGLVPGLIAKLQSRFSSSKLGLASFADQPCDGRGAVTDYPYKLETALTDDMGTISTILEAMTIADGGDTLDSQLLALQMAALAPDAAWSGSDTVSRRILAIITDSGYHTSADSSSLTDNDGDGLLSGTCIEGYPTSIQVKNALLSKGIVPLFVVPASETATYNTLVSELGMGAVVNIASDSSNLIAALEEGVDKIREMVYLVAHDDSAYVSSITPSQRSSVSAGSTVSFTVQLSVCSGCEAGTFRIEALGLGDCDVTIQTSAASCAVGDLYKSAITTKLTNDAMRSQIVQELTGFNDLTPSELSVVLDSKEYKVTFTVDAPATPSYNADVLVLFDASNTMSSIQDGIADALETALETIQTDTSNTYFGAASFLDLPCHTFAPSTDDGSYLFKSEQTMLENPRFATDAVTSLHLPLLDGGDANGAQLFALVLSASSVDVEFRADTRRVIVMATNNSPHVAGDLNAVDPTANVNDGDGTEDGGSCKEDYPTTDIVRRSLLFGNSFPVIVTTADKATEWSSFITNLGFGAVITYAGDSAASATEISDAIKTILDDEFGMLRFAVEDDTGFVTNINPTIYNSINPGDTKTFDVTLSTANCLGSCPVYGDLRVVAPGYGISEVYIQTEVSKDNCDATISATEPTIEKVDWSGYLAFDRLLSNWQTEVDAGEIDLVWTLDDNTSLNEWNPSICVGSRPCEHEDAEVCLPMVGNSCPAGTVDKGLSSFSLASDVQYKVAYDGDYDSGSDSRIKIASVTFDVSMENRVPLVARGYARITDVKTGLVETPPKPLFRIDIVADKTTYNTDGTTTITEESEKLGSFTYSLDTSAPTDWKFVTKDYTLTRHYALKQITVSLYASQYTKVEFSGLGLATDPVESCRCDAGTLAEVLFPFSRRCSRCPAGSACSGSGTQEACATGTMSFGGSTECMSCGSGWSCSGGVGTPCTGLTYTESDGSCSTCPDGYSCKNGIRTACEAGTYGRGYSSCISCPPGTFSDTTAATDCQTCADGERSNSRRSGCVKCPPGHYSTGGDIYCSSCPIGHYTNAEGAPSCTPCIVGEYTDHLASTRCTACPSGTTASTGSTSVDDCA